MPRKGRLSKADRVRESGEAFSGARRAHAAGGPAINSLEHRGLDRVGLMPPARERPVLPAAA